MFGNHKLQNRYDVIPSIYIRVIGIFVLQLVHAGEAIYLRKMNSSFDEDDFEIKLFASKVSFRIINDFQFSLAIFYLCIKYAIHYAGFKKWNLLCWFMLGHEAKCLWLHSTIATFRWSMFSGVPFFLISSGFSLNSSHIGLILNIIFWLMSSIGYSPSFIVY